MAPARYSLKVVVLVLFCPNASQRLSITLLIDFSLRQLDSIEGFSSHFKPGFEPQASRLRFVFPSLNFLYPLVQKNLTDKKHLKLNNISQKDSTL